MPATTFVAVCDIAGVRAVFPFCVAVGGEGLPTVSAGEVVYGSAVDLFRVCIPPDGTAVIRAELDALSAGSLRKQCTALKAESGVQFNAAVVCGLRAGQPNFTTECDNGIFFQSHSFGDGGISISL